MQASTLPPFTAPTPAELCIREVGRDGIDVIHVLNRTIFDEDRVINSFDRDDLLMLVAYADEQPVGFKVGYRENRYTFYSAKGGVLPGYRRQGIARALLLEMESVVRRRGFTSFCYDTFPNRHPGMTVMGLSEGYRLIRADFNAAYRDYRLRFEKRL